MHADAHHPQAWRDDDLLTPVLMALAVHVAIVLLLVLASLWDPAPRVVSVAGPVVEAALVVSDADVAQAIETAENAPKPEPVEAAPPPQPLPAPMPEDSPEEQQPVPQEMIPEPDRVNQDAVAEVVEDPTQEAEKDPQEERRIQDQIDLTERERQAEAERKRRRREEYEAIQREREEAQRRTDQERQRLEQIADARAARQQPQPVPEDRPAERGGNNGTDTDLLAQYVLALQQAIEHAWIRPDTISPDAVCPIRIIQVPGGEVISAEVLPGCPYDALGRRSVEAAVLRAQPLPYDGFEDVFERDIRLNFRATED